MSSASTAACETSLFCIPPDRKSISSSGVNSRWTWTKATWRGRSACLRGSPPTVADITQARDAGLVDLLADTIDLQILADAGYQGRAAQTYGQVVTPPRKRRGRHLEHLQWLMAHHEAARFAHSSAWMPVCSTKRMPHNTCRSGNGFRPGCRNRRSLRGSSGSIRSHRSSDTLHGEVPMPEQRCTSDADTATKADPPRYAPEDSRLTAWAHG